MVHWSLVGLGKLGRLGKLDREILFGKTSIICFKNEWPVSALYQQRPFNALEDIWWTWTSENKTYKLKLATKLFLRKRTSKICWVKRARHVGWLICFYNEGPYQQGTEDYLTLSKQKKMQTETHHMLKKRVDKIVVISTFFVVLLLSFRNNNKSIFGNQVERNYSNRANFKLFELQQYISWNFLTK